jgi:N-acetylglucosaminyl-diphospho-decaprenol L-rhamnosyltransferase
MQSSPIDISTIVVSYNTAKLLPEMMDALLAAQGPLAMETIFIDNASKDDSVAVIQTRYPNCRLITNAVNVGFGRANNQAVPHLQGRYALLLNTDAFVAPDTLAKSVAYMDAHADVGIVGVRLVGRDGVAQPAARSFPTPWDTFLRRSGLIRFCTDHRAQELLPHATAPVVCDWVPGCYYLVRKALIDQIGLLDPRYFLYFEEVDHCLAAKRAGWKVVCLPDTTVVHIGGESAKTEGTITQSGRQLEALQLESELLFYRKNFGARVMLGDLLLNNLADAIITLKRLVKPKGVGSVVAGWRHTRLMWSLVWRTRMGTRPTR